MPTVVTATGLETRVTRRALPPEIRVTQIGIGARGGPQPVLGEMVISCGLAGGVRPDLPTGTVLVPTEVIHPDGTRRVCDESLVAMLLAGARRCGVEPVALPLATSATLVRGSERARYAALGFGGVDMETAFLEAPRIAALRVILDTPLRELSEAWLHPLRPLVTPAAWPQLPWLIRNGPRCARLAAAIVAAALAMRCVGDEHGDVAGTDDPLGDAS